MAKPNYRFAKQQKELARKVRKQQKLERKQARDTEAPAEDPVAATSVPPTEPAR